MLTSILFNNCLRSLGYNTLVYSLTQIGDFIMAVESKFREDKDLAFLQYADWQDLKLLAEALIKDHSGTEQWTGQLKKTLAEMSVCI